MVLKTARDYDQHRLIIGLRMLEVETLGLHGFGGFVRYGTANRVIYPLVFKEPRR